MEAFYRVLGAMELSAEFGYTTREWGNLPLPDGPITVGIDGGYVRDWEAKKHNFEVIVGKSILAFKRDEDEDHPSSKRVGFVQTLDAQFIAVCRRSKWSRHLTNSPFLALLAMAGSKAAYKINSACSKAFC